MSDPESSLNPHRQFATTRWSVVLSAGRDSSESSRQALEKLCDTYWFPLYAFVRRQGFDASRAADLTQGFFADLLQRNDIAGVDRSRGKFRSFLLASIKHYLLNQIDFDRALKRGGGQKTISIDIDKADSRYRCEPFHTETPEKLFDRHWALALLDQVRAALREEFETRGKIDQYNELQVFLSGGPADENYREIGLKLGLSEGAVKVIVHRMRQRFGEILRDEISHTVAGADDIDAEIQELFDVLRG